MIYQELTRDQFRDAFNSIRPDNFSYEGLGTLYDFFNDIGEDMELDVIAICCDFSEYESIEAFQADYGDEYESIDDIDAATLVLELDGGGFIIQNF